MKKNGKFIIKKSIQKYKNPWIEVIEDQVVRPDGKPGIFGIIKISKGVSVLPIDDKGFAYMTKEFHYAIGIEEIETMSGGVKKKESFINAAKRELKEETGIEAKKWIDLGLVNPLTTVVNSPTKLFLARGLSFGQDDQEDMEDVKLVKIKFEKVIKMVQNSEITHAPSCVLVLKAARYLRK